MPATEDENIIKAETALLAEPVHDVNVCPTLKVIVLKAAPKLSAKELAKKAAEIKQVAQLMATESAPAAPKPSAKAPAKPKAMAVKK